MEEFIFDHFFDIAKLTIIIGVAVFIYASSVKTKNAKDNDSDMTRDSNELGDHDNRNNKKTVNQHAGRLKNVGIVAIALGMVLFVIGILAIAFAIYVVFILLNMIQSWG